MERPIILILVLSIALSLCSCGNASESISEALSGQGSSEESSVSIVAKEAQNSGYPDMILTKEEMLQDYDSIWEAFKANSPFLNIIERKHGTEYFEETVAEYRRQIVDMEAAGDDAMLEFIRIIAYSMSEACDVDRHAGIKNPGRYFEELAVYQDLIDEMPLLKPWIDVMEQPQVSAFYDYYDYLLERMIKDNENTSSSSQQEQTKNDQTNDNLSMQILDEGKIAYIKVGSFDTGYMEEDIPRIHAFLESVRDYRHLVIDIRDNGGGNAAYWEEAFARPNISEPVTTTFVRLMRDSSLATAFYGSQYEDTALTVDDVKNNPAFSALKTDDINQLAFAMEYYDTMEPHSEEKLYQGKIWVLTGPLVYSSAESFAVFCKASGFAELVGKTTGGGNTGGAAIFELPNSHLLVTFDVEYALNQDGSCSQEMGTVPDIESEDALQTVLDLIQAN